MDHRRNIYLQMKSLSEARQILFDQFSHLSELEHEAIPVAKAVGRVLAKPAVANLSSPNFHAAAMDGIAVKAKDTFGASENSPKELTVNQNAFFVNTGNVLPDNTDAVIMIEHVNQLDNTHLRIEASAFPWQNVRKMGEDIVATELLFPRNHLITPYCIGALLSGGVFKVDVWKKPKVLIIPTGSELVNHNTEEAIHLSPGQVIESNSYVLSELILSCGGSFHRHERLSDDLQHITDTVQAAVNGDYQLLLILGGSSAGSEDFAKHVISELGTVHVHGVTIMPGKPVIIGDVNGKPVFGIPGYPVSAIIAFEQFVRPLMLHMLGLPDLKRPSLDALPTRKIASKLGVEEFLRVKLGTVGGHLVATPLPRGSGCITSITEADGILRVPNHIEGIRTQEFVPVELLKPAATIKRTVVIVGSHDNSLDILADELKASEGRLSLSSSHVGSMGGLMAIKRKVCHMSGSHLLDSQDGSYNISYIKKYLPDTKLKVFNLVIRDQGLIVPHGNPKRIQGIEDLTREDILLINRQGGSGTRILLDYRLSQLNLEPRNIKGYDSEEFTHMSVAVAVLSGTADVGLGIYAAAKALNLDFIPVVTEQYDLIVPDTFVESDRFQLLLGTIQSKRFQKRVVALGGYSMQKTGELVYSQ